MSSLSPTSQEARGWGWKSEPLIIWLVFLATSPHSEAVQVPLHEPSHEHTKDNKFMGFRSSLEATRNKDRVFIFFQNHMFLKKSCPPGPQNVTSFRSLQIHTIKMRPYWTRMGPKSNDWRSNSPSGDIPQKKKTGLKSIRTPMLMAAWCTITRRLKRPKCPQIGK